MGVPNVKTIHIFSPFFDLFFVVLTPLWSLGIVYLFCGERGDNFLATDKTPFMFGLACSILTHAHILIGFSRSHLNKEVFNRFKLRFTVIPLITLLLMWFVSPVFIFLGTLAIYWDEWHSLMQVFGFARIYDGKQNQNVEIGRKLDMYMSFVVSFFPNIILITYFAESKFKSDLVGLLDIDFEDLDFYANFLMNLRTPLIFFTIFFIVFYIIYFYRKSQNGYVYSWPKFLHFFVLFATTIYATTHYTILDCVFFGNIYHSISYFFIVYITEKKNFNNILTLNKNLETKSEQGFFIRNRSLLFYLCLLVPITFILASIRQQNEKMIFIGAFWILTSLLHFWFDGFMWSVRRREV